MWQKGNSKAGFLSAMEKIKSLLRQRFIRILVLLVILFAGMFLIRNYILHRVIDSYSKTFSEKHHASLAVGSSSFAGWSKVLISDVCLVPDGGDTLIFIQSLGADINFWSLISFHPSVREFEISGMRITARKENNKDNFSFLWKNSSETVTPSGIGYGKQLSVILDKFFGSFPDQISAKEIDFNLSENEQTTHFKIPQLIVTEDSIHGELINSDSKHRLANIRLNGNLNRSNKTISMEALNQNKSNSLFPFLEAGYQAKISFDTLFFSLDSSSFSDDKLFLKGLVFVSGLRINQPKVSLEEVYIKSQKLNYSFVSGSNYFMLDSTSIASLNSIQFNPFLKYQHQPEKIVTLKIKSSSIPSSDFFNSIPQGLCRLANNVKAQGSLRYNLTFEVNLSRLYSVFFSSDLKKENFRLSPESVSKISSVNQPFEYTAFEKGRPVRTFWVGKENPDYFPLMSISELLKNCILTSEDGSFFYHRGFNEEMFGKAIRDNIQKRRFARGASTITMQMVKNVFLSRNKTISRKVEEALLVWLIENNHLISKERILEIYLNIIEWGPDVYGVGEASRFYFLKKPSDLSMEECIFLTSIIPNPKMFKYSFEKNGNLKGSLSYYYKLISGILLHKMVITDSEYEQIHPSVKITGRAKSFILSPDSIPPDSMMLDRIEMMK